MKIQITIYPILAILLLWSCQSAKENPEEAVLHRLNTILYDHDLQQWYPRAVDTINGGFYSNYSSTWEKMPSQPKFIVTQARHVWTLSKVAEFDPEREEYSNYARHGYEFLRDHMWDEEFGGFFETVDSTGNIPVTMTTIEKRAYGNAFGIYALAAYFKLSQDSEVLTMAQKAFQWLDHSAHDPAYGGYFQYLERDGSPISRDVLSENYQASDRALVGLKDYNSSIHILEALSELYHVWPDDTLRKRLEEMHSIVSGVMMDERGFLKLHFYPDWTLVPDQELIDLAGEAHFYTNHITFGHDVETAYLLLESNHALGRSDNEILPLAKKILDHSLQYGWDEEVGGFYEQGKYVNDSMKILDNSKNWWAQSEGLNTLLLMSKYFPDDSHNYYNQFLLQLDYIEKNLLDQTNKGWYSYGIDAHPEYRDREKASVWKGNYHTVRSAMNCLSNMNHNPAAH